MNVEKGQRYRHYKGNEYVILAIGYDTETEEKVVIYEGQYADPTFGDRPVWVRPYAMFIESVTVNGRTTPRFTHVV